MNSTFNSTRWSLLLKQHWAENKKRYLLFALALTGIVVMWFFYLLMIDEGKPMEQEMQFFTYFFLLFTSGCFFAGQFFKDLSSKSKAINYLLTPASAFEKFLTAWLIGVVVFFITFSVIYFAADAFMVGMANAFHPYYNQPGPGGVIPKAQVVNVFGDFALGNGGTYLFAAYFAVQSAFLLGSIYFEKYGLIKTIICIFGFFLVIYLTISFLSETMLPQGGFHAGLASYRVVEGAGPSPQDVVVELPKWIRDLLYGLVLVGLPIWFWLVTYQRLKEKEV